MKKIFILLMSFCWGAISQPVFAATDFPDWQMGVHGWFALDASFDEQPGPDTSGHVWGDFPTMNYEVNISKSIFNHLKVDLSFGKSMILDSQMFLHSESLSTDFNGEGMEMKANCIYRIPLLSMFALDLGIGYQYVDAIKRFYDMKENGVVINAGNWGNYKIAYQGMMFTAATHYWIMPEWDVFATIIGSPIMKNQTEVSGYGTPLKEEASGLRYRWQIGADYAPVQSLVFTCGYRYEDIYFNEPASDSFSLHIIYSGLFVEAGYRF